MQPINHVFLHRLLPIWSAFILAPKLYTQITQGPMKEGISRLEHVGFLAFQKVVSKVLYSIDRLFFYECFYYPETLISLK